MAAHDSSWKTGGTRLFRRTRFGGQKNSEGAAEFGISTFLITHFNANVS